MILQRTVFRVSCDPRGKITAGEKSEKGLPKSLEYFNISKFPELISAYGTKPDKLVVVCPSDNPDDFVEERYVLYGKSKTKDAEGQVIRSCDQHTCFHRIKETIGGTTYAEGENSPCFCAKLEGEEAEKKACRYHLYLKMFVAIPDIEKIEHPLCYMFASGSRNSGDAIVSELKKVQSLNSGRLMGVPFWLSVRMVSGKDAKSRFPIWSLIPIGTVSQIRSGHFLSVGEGETTPQGQKALPEQATAGISHPETTPSDEKPFFRPSETDKAKTLKKEYLAKIKAAPTRVKLEEVYRDALAKHKEGKLMVFDIDELTVAAKARAKGVK